MPNDKFIFVNAPTIINAGPRDARRQLRSQLMRRVYLKKYQITPPLTEDDVDDNGDGKESSSYEQSPPKSAVGSSPEDSENEKNLVTKKQRVIVPRSPLESKLPTPPIDEDDPDAYEDDEVWHASKQDSDIVRKEKPSKSTGRVKQRILTGDPRMTIGVSFLDPFDPYLNDQTHCPNGNMLFHHYSENLMPMMRSAVIWRTTFFNNYMGSKIEPLLFHTLCLSAAGHLDTLMMWHGVEADRRGREFEQSFYRYSALRELRRSLVTARFGTPGFDAILVSICLLSISDPMSELPPSVGKMDYNPFNHILQPIGGLNVYGYQPVHPVHWKGLLALINQHGGLDRIQLYSAKWNISYTAIKYALHTCTKPAFPIYNPWGECLIRRTPLDIMGIFPSDLPSTAGTAFKELKMYSMRDIIQRTFVELGQLAQSMQMITPRVDDPDLMDAFIDARNVVQYRFQNLPLPTDDPSDIVDPSTVHEFGQENVYTPSAVELASIVFRMCWVVGYLFTTQITFPMPCSRKFRQNTVFEIRDAIKNCGHTLERDPWVLGLQLWCAVLGAIAAEDIDAVLYQWMVQKVGDLCARLGIETWNQVVDIMISFAWMEAACEQGSRKLWAQVQNLNNQALES